MSQPHPDSEAALENATIALFAELGYTTANCYTRPIPANSGYSCPYSVFL